MHIGALVDEYVERPGRGDFLTRAVTGADESTGAIEVGDRVELGTTMQFHVRDAASADDDLRAALDRARMAAPGPIVGALLFTCNGRGRRMFGVPDHDATLVGKLLDGIPLAGFFAAGELGPIGAATRCTASPHPSRCSSTSRRDAAMRRPADVKQRSARAPDLPLSSRGAVVAYQAGSRRARFCERSPLVTP